MKDESEAPNIYYKNYWLYRILRIDSVYLDYYYKLFDGLLLITDGLVDLLKTRIKKNAFIVKVPMTVDFERFNNYIDKKNHKLSYILYIGSLNENKDGVTTLIESFNLVAKKYKDINLILIGNALSNQYSDLLKHKVRSFGLQNKIKFISRISSSEIISYIFNAKVLALARPMSSQAEYSFPTKLGEYLASGKPVVVTKVGEIPRYLIDRENAYLAEPSNITSFAAKLDEALGDYDKAVMIGEQGKKTASENFDVYKNTKPVFDYIIVMLQKKQEHRK